MFELSELKQSRYYRETIQEGESGIILRQLSRRFGNLTSEVTATVRQLPSSQLEVLADALLEFSTLQDLLIWLEAHKP